MIVHPMNIVDSNPLEIVETPPLFRRLRRPGPHTISPFLASFGSESGSSSKKPKNFHQKYSFNRIADILDTGLYLRFFKWLTEGLLGRHHTKKRPEDDRYRKGFKKMQIPLELRHIGVIIIWDAYSDLENGPCNASSEEVIRLYIKGFRLCAAVLWHTVDNILIPVNLKDKFHWILLVLSFNDRAIMVYDSMKSVAHDAYIFNEVNKFAQLIPTYLVSSGFYDRSGIDPIVHPKYKLHSEDDPFNVVHVSNILEQHERSLDCGVYVAVYAEYLSEGNGIPNSPVDIELMLNRYATLLWDYRTRKVKNEAVSDNEAPGRLASNTNPSEGVKHVVLQ